MGSPWQHAVFVLEGVLAAIRYVVDAQGERMAASREPAGDRSLWSRLGSGETACGCT